MADKPIQETTSTYFNYILKPNAVPLSVDRLEPEVIEEFNRIIDSGFGDEAEAVKRRFRYLIPYVLQAIDWNAYGIPLEAWQLRYYYQRDRFLQKTGLSYEDFLNNEYLMEAVGQLQLDPEPTFEFILFLKYYFDLRAELRYSSVEMLQKLKDALKPGSERISMDVVVDGRHFKFANSHFIKRLFESVDETTLGDGAFNNDFNEGGSRDKIRALDYYLVKTLLDYLPMKVERRRGQYSQAERNFVLSVLNFTGRLIGDDREFICGFYNNATFDKLMRDFKEQPIPFAMELFL